MKNMTINMNETIYVRVCNRLRNDILNGVFDSGMRLVIADLVKRYGVSQMPIREALQQLQGEGVVVMLPQKGAHVCKIDETLISNMYDIRACIEVMLVMKALQFMSNERIQQLEQIEAEFESAVIRNDFSALLMHNENFHRVINSCAGNPEATRIIDHRWGLIDNLRRKFGFSKSRLEEAVQDHQNLIRAIKERDEQSLVKLTRKHVLEAKSDLIIRMQEAASEARSEG
ncbi:DNA-binding transcriptional regulator, GntR family [Paenibacillus algorifonticola]|uniref:DNA-binding transcriptional regulator, GntR family n=1 Tax=Paenibacillus algorifonticola TaxID=684063 RepID=A0A1I2GX63_9BACL|nr:GntR family transcriptional regulator [Paenibacillus algorifonticola]SFF21151.1 DNA-binding transcriptional regulator, GntR family [Paenibacillus algorifonticola]